MARVGDHPLSKQYRLRQILRYLESKYPTPYPVALHFTRIPLRGERGATVRHGRVLRILINLNLDMYHAAETLVHEYAHARDWRHERQDKTRKHHASEWGVSYAELYSDFYDEGGAERSKLF